MGLCVFMKAWRRLIDGQVYGRYRASRYSLRPGTARVMDVVAAGHPGALIGVAWACSVAPVVIDHRTLNASARRFAFVAWQCGRRIYHALAIFTKAIGIMHLSDVGGGFAISDSLAFMVTGAPSVPFTQANVTK